MHIESGKDEPYRHVQAVHIKMQDYKLDCVCCGDGNTLLKDSNMSN